MHEVAHLTTWNKFGRRVKSHGKEWKEEFRLHIDPILNLRILPDDVTGGLSKYSFDPKASSCTDVELMKILKRYDENNDYVHLDNIPEKSIFKLRNGLTFIKGEKIRKRYKCLEVNRKRYYLISPVAEVSQITLF